MKEQKALAANITTVVENKLKESGEQSKAVRKAIKKSASKLAKKITKLGKKADKKLKKAEKAKKPAKINLDKAQPLVAPVAVVPA